MCEILQRIYLAEGQVTASRENGNET